MSSARDSAYLPRRPKSSASCRSSSQIATRFDVANPWFRRSLAVRSRTACEVFANRSDASICGASTVVDSMPTRSRTAPDVAFSLSMARARAFSALPRSASERRQSVSKPTMLDASVNARMARSDANAGRRRHQRAACSSFETGRARIGNPSSQRCRSSASAQADAYRRRGSFRRQVSAIVSRSRGRPGTSVLERRGLTCSHQIEGLDHRRGLERRTSGQEAVKGSPKGIDVGSRTDGGAVAANLFRSHERGSTPHSDLTGRRRARVVARPGDSEVGDHGVT